MTNDDALLRTPGRSRGYVGQIIGGKYVVVRLLGEGGMGSVYEVKHLVIGRRFAIKLLRWEMAHGPSAVARFKREAEAAGRLENEHIVAVVDVGATDEGTPYLVMEYLQGEHLAALLARRGPLPVARAVQLVLQVCQGLRAAHAHGVIHRDLKPENLFVVPGSDGAELVKILDFGIVKLTTENSAAITHSAQTLGTPYYMSPEQARGDSQIDARTDIYAVGVLLYELLTASRPHPGSNATAVLFHLLKQEPIRIETLRAGLPTGLPDVIHRAFAFEAAERFPDVDSLYAALAPYAATAARYDVPLRLPAPALDASAGTLSSSELKLPEGGKDAPGVIASVPPSSASLGLNRFFSGATLTLAVLAASLLFFARSRLARPLDVVLPPSPSPAALEGAAPRGDDKPLHQVPVEVSERALERPFGHSVADASAAPSLSASPESSPNAATPPPPRRPASSPPAATPTARRLLRDQLYEP